MGDIYLQRLQRRLGNLVYEATRVQFYGFGSASWHPDLNVYRCEKCIVVCVDLAGVEKAAIDLRAEPKRLLIRGQRKLPAPIDPACAPMQVLDMEIDYGAFEREILFPIEIETARVTAEQKNGLLWITLPLRSHA